MRRFTLLNHSAVSSATTARYRLALPGDAGIQAPALVSCLIPRTTPTVSPLHHHHQHEQKAFNSTSSFSGSVRGYSPPKPSNPFAAASAASRVSTSGVGMKPSSSRISTSPAKSTSARSAVPSSSSPSMTSSRTSTLSTTTVKSGSATTNITTPSASSSPSPSSSSVPHAKVSCDGTPVTVVVSTTVDVKLGELVVLDGGRTGIVTMVPAPPPRIEIKPTMKNRRIIFGTEILWSGEQNRISDPTSWRLYGGTKLNASLTLLGEAKGLSDEERVLAVLWTAMPTGISTSKSNFKRKTNSETQRLLGTLYSCGLLEGQVKYDRLLEHPRVTRDEFRGPNQFEKFAQFLAGEEKTAVEKGEGFLKTCLITPHESLSKTQLSQTIQHSTSSSSPPTAPPQSPPKSPPVATPSQNTGPCFATVMRWGPTNGSSRTAWFQAPFAVQVGHIVACEGGRPGEVLTVSMTPPAGILGGDGEVNGEERAEEGETLPKILLTTGSSADPEHGVNHLLAQLHENNNVMSFHEKLNAILWTRWSRGEAHARGTPKSHRYVSATMSILGCLMSCKFLSGEAFADLSKHPRVLDDEFRGRGQFGNLSVFLEEQRDIIRGKGLAFLQEDLKAVKRGRTLR